MIGSCDKSICWQCGYTNINDHSFRWKGNLTTGGFEGNVTIGRTGRKGGSESDEYFIMQVNLIEKTILIFGSGIKPKQNTVLGYLFNIDQNIINHHRPFRIALSLRSEMDSGIGLGIVKLERYLNSTFEIDRSVLI